MKGGKSTVGIVSVVCFIITVAVRFSPSSVLIIRVVVALRVVVVVIISVVLRTGSWKRWRRWGRVGTAAVACRVWGIGRRRIATLLICKMSINILTVYKTMTIGRKKKKEEPEEQIQEEVHECNFFLVLIWGTQSCILVLQRSSSMHLEDCP